MLDIAKNGVSSWFGRIVQNLSEGDWATIPFNQSYAGTSDLNKVTANIIVTLFLDKKQTTRGELLSVTYMYILGVGGIGILTHVFTPQFLSQMFYEEVPTKLLLTNSLYTELCKNLKPDIESVRHLVLILYSQLIPNTLQYIPPSKPKGDQWELNYMLFQFAKQEFQKSFGFEWGGKNSKPKDPGVFKFKIPFSVLIDLEANGTDSPNKEAIEKRISLAAFRYTRSQQFFVATTLTDLPERTDPSFPGDPNHRNRPYRVCTLAFSS